jgi:hypothetical protein
MFVIGGNADEGIKIEPVGDKNTMTPGADGSVMHSLAVSKACTVTITLLKTSPTNALLVSMFNFQTASSARHGQNTLVVRDSARNDLHTITEAAFKKMPAITYAKEGGTVEWQIDGGVWDPELGGADIFDIFS